jgi:hypothetical protein
MPSLALVPLRQNRIQDGSRASSRQCSTLRGRQSRARKSRKAFAHSRRPRKKAVCDFSFVAYKKPPSTGGKLSTYRSRRRRPSAVADVLQDWRINSARRARLPTRKIDGLENFFRDVSVYGRSKKIVRGRSTRGVFRRGFRGRRHRALRRRQKIETHMLMRSQAENSKGKSCAFQTTSRPKGRAIMSALRSTAGIEADAFARTSKNSGD